MSIRVLLVEPDAVLVQLLSSWLQQQEMQTVACVDTAEAALKACEEHQPHLALVAFKALPTSVPELIRQMHEKCPSMQILVSSFWAYWEDIQEAKRWGARAGFARPPSPEAFQHALKACHFNTP